MACNPEVLKHVPLFALLDEDETAILAGQVELRKFAPRQRIYKMGEAGWVAHFSRPSVRWTGAFFRILCENWGDGSATRLRSSTLRLEGWRRSRRLCETWGREIPTSPCAITLATNGPSSPDCRCHSYARDPVLWGCSMEDRGGD